MNPTLKKAILHTLAGLGSTLASVAMSYVIKEIVPQLPQTGLFALALPFMLFFEKWLRENPNIPKVPDWVNKN